MRFFPMTTLYSLAFVFALSLWLAKASPLAKAASLPRSTPWSLAKRQMIVPSHGFTAAPANGTTIEHGTSFDFSYDNANYRHSGTARSRDVTNDGGLVEGSYVVAFGDYLIANFGLPPMQPTPPPTLTMPTLDAIASGSTLYFSVVETYNVCPGHIAFEYGLEVTTVVYV
ncbi:hypothetical protein BD414DRAFT_531603 [Trametes punicea]|nr:hypothetical protein BD414DRAFT_531603 [Trametes punicea]